MRYGVLAIVASILLLATFALFGTAAILANGSGSNMMGSSSSGDMMGPGGMMGGSGGMTGCAAMMGGSQAGATPSGTPVTGVTQVAMANFAFAPANIQVRTGTTVTWTNDDQVSHTVTFRNGGVDSSILRTGQSFRYTFTTPGSYDYYCSIHPYMVGRVTVTS
jgi:plastocyanin